MRMGANATILLARHTVSRGVASGTIEARSMPFAIMRGENSRFVDKTDAIAELLCGKDKLTRRAFFARPRKFGKSLTLDIMATLLRAGELPLNVTPWGGYEPVDVAALFRDMLVFERFQRKDPADVALHVPHFVVKLELGEVHLGNDLKALMLSQLGEIAADAFGKDFGEKVERQPSAGSALRLLVNAVPKPVPVAVLVDEYDAAIVHEVSVRNWASAREGINALRDLFMPSKGVSSGQRLAHFVVTGVARFARTAMFAGANNFEDISMHPALCRAIGFTRGEIENVFARELEALVVLPSAKPITLPSSGASPASGASSSLPSNSSKLDALAWWFNDYCFDGRTSCFNPYGVLHALKTGSIDGTELEGASGIDWLGLSPTDVMDKLWWEHDQQRVSLDAVKRINIADLEARSVDARAMLLQVGLLSLKPITDTTTCRDDEVGHTVLCQAPNEYARASLRAMARKALGGMWLGPRAQALIRALQDTDAVQFEAVVKPFLQALPYSMLNAHVGSPDYEAPFHAALWAFLYSCVPTQVAVAVPEAAHAGGRADIVIHFSSKPVVWVLELGAGNDSDAKKLAQAQRYAKAHTVGNDVEVVCCAITVAKAKAAKAKVAKKKEGCRGRERGGRGQGNGQGRVRSEAGRWRQLRWRRV